MVAITARANTGVVAQGGGVYRITKTGGFDESFDAAAASVTPIAGDFALRAKRVGSASRLMIGVTANPDEDTGYIGIDYSAAYNAAVIEVFERGDYRTFTYLVGDFLWIDRIGATLRYRCGAKRKDATVIRTVTGVTAPLYFDSSLVTPGCAVDVRFDAIGTWTDPQPPARRAHLAIGCPL